MPINLTSTKIVELKNVIQIENPLLVAVSEVKLNNSGDRIMIDYEIPNYTLHSINLDKDIGRGMAVYTHLSIDKSIIDIKPGIQFEELCLLELKLRGCDTLLFGSFYRSPTKTTTSDANLTAELTTPLTLFALSYCVLTAELTTPLTLFALSYCVLTAELTTPLALFALSYCVLTAETKVTKCLNQLQLFILAFYHPSRMVEY